MKFYCWGQPLQPCFDKCISTKLSEKLKTAHEPSYPILLMDPIWGINLLRNKMSIRNSPFIILSFSSFLFSSYGHSFIYFSSFFSFSNPTFAPPPYLVSSFSPREFSVLLFYFFNAWIHISFHYALFPIDDLFLYGHWFFSRELGME